MPRSMRALLALVVGLVAVAGCGGDDGGGGASSSACPNGAVTIKMVDTKFDPETATASVGDTVCWVNEDSIQHNAVAESGASFKSELFNKGETFTAKLDQAGDVKYVCTVHPGMTGDITVK